MSRFKRILSAITVASFIVNTALSGFALAQGFDPGPDRYDLAVSSRFDDLHGIEAKDIGDIELWFVAALKSINRSIPLAADNIVDTLRKFDRKPGNSVFTLKGTKFLIAAAGKTEEGNIRIEVKRRDLVHGTRAYYIEYSPARECVEVYPKGKSRERSERDRAAIARYLQHERGIDEAIRFAHENGLAKEPIKERFDYRTRALQLLEKLNIQVAPPDPKALFPVTDIADRRFYLINLTPKIHGMMEALPKAKIVDRDGMEHEIRYEAHSSNNAVHVFVGKSIFESMTDPSLSAADIENITQYRDELMVPLVHEVGVMLGLVPDRLVSYSIGEGYKYAENEVDRRWQALYKNPDAKFSRLILHTADLDADLRTRDYAAAPKPERKQSVFDCDPANPVVVRSADGKVTYAELSVTEISSSRLHVKIGLPSTGVIVYTGEEIGDKVQMTNTRTSQEDIRAVRGVKELLFSRRDGQALVIETASGQIRVGVTIPEGAAPFFTVTLSGKTARKVYVESKRPVTVELTAQTEQQTQPEPEKTVESGKGPKEALDAVSPAAPVVVSEAAAAGALNLRVEPEEPAARPEEIKADEPEKGISENVRTQARTWFGIGRGLADLLLCGVKESWMQAITDIRAEDVEEARSIVYAALSPITLPECLEKIPPAVYLKKDDILVTFDKDEPSARTYYVVIGILRRGLLFMRKDIIRAVMINRAETKIAELDYKSFVRAGGYQLNYAVAPEGLRDEFFGELDRLDAWLNKFVRSGGESSFGSPIQLPPGPAEGTAPKPEDRNQSGTKNIEIKWIDDRTGGRSMPKVNLETLGDEIDEALVGKELSRDESFESVSGMLRSNGDLKLAAVLDNLRFLVQEDDFGRIMTVIDAVRVNGSPLASLDKLVISKAFVKGYTGSDLSVPSQGAGNIKPFAPDGKAPKPADSRSSEKTATPLAEDEETYRTVKITLAGRDAYVGMDNSGDDTAPVVDAKDQLRRLLKPIGIGVNTRFEIRGGRHWRGLEFTYRGRTVEIDATYLSAHILNGVFRELLSADQADQTEGRELADYVAELAEQTLVVTPKPAGTAAGRIAIEGYSLPADEPLPFDLEMPNDAVEPAGAFVGMPAFEDAGDTSILQEALDLLPDENLDGWLDIATFVQAVKKAGYGQDVVEGDNKSALIFSERATFGELKDDGKFIEGIGVVLPSLVKSDARVAVIATADRQRALIDELNEGRPEDKRIICVENVAAARQVMPAARYYYFKVAAEADAGMQGVTSITIIVEKIIEAIGRVVNISDARLVERMHEAARKFAEAA